MCKCIFCETNLGENNITQNECITIYECPKCGCFIIPASTKEKFRKNDEAYNKYKIGKYLFYHERWNKNFYIGSDESFKIYKKNNPNSKALCISMDMIEKWYPQKFSDKIDLMLLKMQEDSAYDGYWFDYENAKDYCFVSKNNLDNGTDVAIECLYYIDYLASNGYIQIEGFFPNSTNRDCFRLTYKALERVYELQRTQSNNKNVFIAMKFSAETNEIRNAIKNGIEATNYSSVLMDEIVHNHQIVPEMLRLIKESRFLIMDITYPNFGAYFEAGYAQGLGKEVIVTCKREVFNLSEFACAHDEKCDYKRIATKPHFDIAQKQILVWDNYTDLTKKLSEWIKYLFGER